MKISIVIIARNAQQHIAKCLGSLTRFDDVVLYVNDCTDETVAIASGFANVNVVEGYFDGFGPTKDRAATFAKHDWVMTLDSDEVIPPQLLAEMRELELQPGQVFAFRRLNHYAGKPMRCCGWENDTIARLYDRNTTSYGDQAVHESLNTGGMKVIVLSHSIHHFPFDNLRGLMHKADYYSGLFATAQAGKQTSSVATAAWHGLAMFIKSFFIKKGFLNGYEGFVISFFNGYGTTLKYLKLMEKNRS